MLEFGKMLGLKRYLMEVILMFLKRLMSLSGKISQACGIVCTVYLVLYEVFRTF